MYVPGLCGEDGVRHVGWDFDSHGGVVSVVQSMGCASRVVSCGGDGICLVVGVELGRGDVVGMVPGLVFRPGVELCLGLGYLRGMTLRCGSEDGTILCLGYERRPELRGCLVLRLVLRLRNKTRLKLRRYAKLRSCHVGRLKPRRCIKYRVVLGIGDILGTIFRSVKSTSPVQGLDDKTGPVFRTGNIPRLILNLSRKSNSKRRTGNRPGLKAGIVNCLSDVRRLIHRTGDILGPGNEVRLVFGRGDVNGMSGMSTGGLGIGNVAHLALVNGFGDVFWYGLVHGVVLGVVVGVEQG